MMMDDENQRASQNRKELPATVRSSVVMHVVSPVSRGAVECIDDFDDLYQCGLAAAQRSGLMDAFSEGFDPGACCSVAERALLDDIRAFLRPDHAPESLVRRCLDCLDECDCADGDKGEEIPIEG